MSYTALAQVNYYEMEGEWNRVVEGVVGNPFSTLEEAKEGCRRREFDQIVWEEVRPGEWHGTTSGNLVLFKITGNEDM